MKKKSVCTLLIGVLMAAMLTACGGTTEAEPTVPASSEVVESTEPSVEVEPSTEATESKEKEDVESSVVEEPTLNYVEQPDGIRVIDNTVIKAHKDEPEVVGTKKFLSEPATVQFSDRVPIYTNTGYEYGYLNPGFDIKINGYSNEWVRLSVGSEGYVVWAKKAEVESVLVADGFAFETLEEELPPLTTTVSPENPDILLYNRVAVGSPYYGLTATMYSSNDESTRVEVGVLQDGETVDVTAVYTNGGKSEYFIAEWNGQTVYIPCDNLYIDD